MSSDDRDQSGAAGNQNGSGLSASDQRDWQNIVLNLLQPSEPGPFDLGSPEVPPAPERTSTLTVRISLAEVEPQVWRRLELAGDLTLEQVHAVLVEAMGWADYHLHRFWVGDEQWGSPHFVTDGDIEEGEDGVNEADVRLDQVLRSPGDRLGYTYDFGDNWSHALELEAVADRDPSDPAARCTGGERACPPEDCGGAPSYEEIADAVRAGRLEADLPDYAEWLPPGFDPDAFDLEATDRAVAHAAVDSFLLRRLPAELQTLCLVAGEPALELIRSAAAPIDELTADEIGSALHQLLFLLRLAGDDGLPLTAAGYLKPSIVEEIYTGLGMDRTWIGKGNREDLTPPVAELRRTAQALGLLRKRKDRLLTTRFGREAITRPLRLWEGLPDRLPAGDDEAERLAGGFVLLAAAAGVTFDDALRAAVARSMTDMGWRTGGGPVQRHHVVGLARPTVSLMELCGGYATRSGLMEPRRPTRAGRALARAALGLSDVAASR